MTYLAARNRGSPTNLTTTELFGSLAVTPPRFFDNEDGTCTLVAQLQSGETIRGTVEGRDDIRPGEHYRFLGRWDAHHRHGWQFAFVSFVRDVPTDVESLIVYLARWCPGIGDATARRLVERHGHAAADILATTPGALVEEGLLRQEVADLASQSLRELCDPVMRRAHLDLFALFRGHGFQQGKAIKACLRKWGIRAAEVVRRDPFVLLTSGIPSCGFARCDKVYLALGRDPARLKRQGLAAWNAIRQRDGDTWHHLGEALRAIEQQITHTCPRAKRAVALMFRAGWIVGQHDEAGHYCLAERHRNRNEMDVALKVRELSAGGSSWPQVQSDQLSEHQAGELSLALVSRVAVLTGSPGTGKTHTATAVIREVVRAFGPRQVVVCAPTGKASVRISEKMIEAGLGLQRGLSRLR